jgi:hypothetical protein
MRLDDIRFDTTNCALRNESANTRVWTSPEGDGFGLTLFALPPDLRATPSSLDQLRSFYRSVAEPAGVGLIEVETARSIVVRRSAR